MQVADDSTNFIELDPLRRRFALSLVVSKESKEKKQKLWGGRFEGGLSAISEKISESISYDHELYRFDIKASMVHADMLAAQKIITIGQNKNIQKGLTQVLREFEAEQIEFDPALEDIHTHVEKRLVEIIGDDGKRLHTGRSRNDQVAVDVHLYLRSAIEEQRVLLADLLQILHDEAKKHTQTTWAGYTHMQIAQPVYLAHYLLAYFWKFARDFDLLNFSHSECNASPLGSGAMAGANYPIDREQTASALGFGSLYANSMDAVSTRDYQLSYHFFATRLFLHISRMCEDLILYSSAEFGYVRMSDQVTTGSSIMPQKKNPDIAELLRGKSGRVIGNMQALVTNLKGLPVTYNRDLQEDKIYLFDTVRQVALGLLGLREILSNMRVFPERVIANLERGFAQATDVADYLVAEQGLPFRDAHELSGQLVRYCEEQGKTISELNDDDIAKAWADKFTLPAEVRSLAGCMNRKQGIGSTSVKEIERQLQQASQRLSALRGEGKS